MSEPAAADDEAKAHEGDAGGTKAAEPAGEKPAADEAQAAPAKLPEHAEHTATGPKPAEEAKPTDEAKPAEEPRAAEAKPEAPKPAEEAKPEAPKSAEEAKPEEPRPEAPAGEEPRFEEPKAGEPEEPKAEEPKLEEPKAGEPEEPKAEEPKPEEPKGEDAEAPKPEGAAEIAEPVVEPPPPPPAPVIARVEPDHGPLSGGLTLLVTGEAFAEGCQVLMDDTPAVTVRDSDTRLQVQTPARAQKGFVDLRVVNPDGQVAVYDEDFRYDPAPSIVGTEPACLTTAGGAVLTVLGADFAQGCAVRIDGALVPSSWAHAGRVEAVSQRHDPGEVDLAVENPDGQRVVRERAVRYAAPPRITGVEPPSGITAGGTEVTVAGSGFEPGSTVLLDGRPVEGATFVGEAELRFTTPRHDAVETVELGVVNPTGLACRRNAAFTFVRAPPRVFSVTPSQGPSEGGTVLTLCGEDFEEGAAVFVCGLPARVAFVGRGELAVTTPPVVRDGLVDVRVVNPDDQAATADKAFRYVAPLPAPELREVSPKAGLQAGGLKVALLGEGFADGVQVRFGTVEAKVQFLTGKELAVTTPAFSGYGAVAVAVTNPDGQHSALDGAFTYEAKPAPEITGIAPTNGPTLGGTRVVVEGKNFTRDAAVFIGREHPRDIVFKGPGEIHIVTPPRKQAGVVDLEVSVPGAPKGVMKNGFRYDAAPAPLLTSVSPNAGTPAGGTEMTLSGKNFVKETVVLVDGKPPKGVKLVDASTLELKTPPGDAGKMVDVLVRNPDGKEAVQKRAFLYDPRYRG